MGPMGFVAVLGDDRGRAAAAIGHLRTNDRTKAYVARRIADGHSKLEAIRCLKRYIAREKSTTSYDSEIARSVRSKLPLDT